jgi:hypothetical protein
MGGTAHNPSTDSLIVILTHISTTIAQHTKGRLKNPQIPFRTSLLIHDISGTFNNTDTKVLFNIMEERRMPRYLNQVKAFTSDRTVFFSFDSQTEPPAPFKCGLPHGLLVSQILFLIVANLVIESPIPGHDLAVSYIDDIGMTVKNILYYNYRKT